MPVQGVTEEEVRGAVAQLEQEGRRVGLKTVRAQLGRGSNTTLLRHLQRIRPRLDEQRRVAPPPASVRTELDVLLARVWATACQDAARSEAAAFVARREALEAQRRQLSADCAELRTAAERLLERVERAERQLRAMQRRLAGAAWKEVEVEVAVPGAPVAAGDGR